MSLKVEEMKTRTVFHATDEALFEAGISGTPTVILALYAAVGYKLILNGILPYSGAS
jgi:hypothetical protein